MTPASRVVELTEHIAAEGYVKVARRAYHDYELVSGGSRSIQGIGVSHD